MPLTGVVRGESSGEALELSVAPMIVEVNPPPGMDLEVLLFARQMFVGGPGWPVLPPRHSMMLDPSNFQQKVAGEVAVARQRS